MNNKKFSIYYLVLLFTLLSPRFALGIEYSFNNSDLNRKLIELYEASPSIWEENNLYIIAVCYVIEKQYSKSEAVLKKYFKKYPNKIEAVRGLGNTYFLQKKFREAKKYYEMGWQLNDIKSLSKLLITNLKLLELDDIKKLLPDLLANKDKSLELKKGLIIYSLFSKPPDKELFLEILEGLKSEEILKDENLKQTIKAGIKEFDLEDMKIKLGL